MGGFGWGGVLCWDGVSGCRVCGGVDKDWGGVDRELGGELCGVGEELGGVGSSRMGWVGWSRVSGVAVCGVG